MRKIFFLSEFKEDEIIGVSQASLNTFQSGEGSFTLSTCNRYGEGDLQEFEY